VSEGRFGEKSFNQALAVVLTTEPEQPWDRHRKMKLTSTIKVRGQIEPGLVTFYEFWHEVDRVCSFNPGAHMAQVLWILVGW